METRPRRRSRLLPLALVLGACLGLPKAVRAGDVMAFAAISAPSENWTRGYGASLSSTWFRVLNFEAEAARIPGETPEITMTSFTGSAFLAPPIGVFVPYGGVGVGVFRQTTIADSDTGTLKCLVLGAKLRLGPIFVVKGEYRSLHLSGTPLLAMDRRLSLGAGISF